MTVREIADKLGYTIIAGEEGCGREAAGVFCCDLLSLAMGRAKADCVWVTVMGNVNVVAVAALADVACVVLAEGTEADADAVAKADTRGISLLAGKLPVFETAKAVYDLLSGAV